MEDLFNMGLDTGMGTFDKKNTKQNDGILRLDPKTAKDPKKGLRVVLRFLPNLTKDGKLGLAAIEKYVHYVKLQDYPELNGYYDSMKNFNEKCDLTNMYWELKNSTSAMLQDKAELISRTTKYYSYVQIVEHESEPELVGKIMIFSFGIKIKNKINEERTGEISNQPTNVYDLVNGKEFVCIVKEIGGFTNYDSSQFKSNPSVILIPNKEGILKEVPTIEEDGKKRIDPKFEEKVKGYLSTRDFELEDFSAKRWDEKQKENVTKILGVLKNDPIVTANGIASAVSKSDSTFFDAEDEDDLPFANDKATKQTAGGAKSEDDFFDF